MKKIAPFLICHLVLLSSSLTAEAQIVTRFPFERKVVTDPVTGTLKRASDYHRICGRIPSGMRAGANLALDASEDGRSMNLCIIPVPAEWLQVK